MSRKPAQKSKKLEKCRRKNHQWKKELISKRKAKKYKQATFRYLSVFGLFLLSFVIITGFLGYKKLSQSLVSAYSYNSFDLRTEDIFVVSYIEVGDLPGKNYDIQKLEVHMYDVTSKKHTVFDFDVDTPVDVVGRYSEEPLRKILHLGTSLNNDDLSQGIDVLNTTLSKKLGIHIDKFVLIDTKIAGSFDTAIFNADIRSYKNLPLLNSFNNSLKTDLRLSEFYYINKLANEIDNGAVFATIVDKSTSNETIDSSIRDLTFDSRVALERKSVAVLNGSKMEGIAGFGSRIIENLGGRVVGVDNASKTYDKTLLIADSTNSETVSELIKYFGDDIEVVDKSSLDNVYDSEFIRADIVLIMGIDITDQL